MGWFPPAPNVVGGLCQEQGNCGLFVGVGDNEKKKNRSTPGGGGGGGGGGGFRSAESKNGFTVKMGGIPYRATVEEIEHFFLPEATCSSVRIMKNRDNRPSGEAIVEFDTEEEARSIKFL